MNRVRLKGMLRKEFIQLRRDKRLFPMLFFAPLFQLFLFGYAVSLDIKDVPMVVVDNRNDSFSREVILSLISSGYFRVICSTHSLQVMDRKILMGEANAGIIINEDGKIGVFIDGSDNNAAGIIQGYFEQVLSRFSNHIPEVYPIPRFLFNPEMKSVNYMVPGVAGMVILIIASVLAAGILVKEKEIGTMEHLLVTPISPAEMVLGKLIPFIFISYIEMGLVIPAGIIFFHIPFRGNILFLIVATFPFIITILSIGLLSSIISSTQQQAVMTAFLFMFPNIVLSGFIFPIENMPDWLQKITYLLPFRYYMTILRSVFLKGGGFPQLWREILILCIFALFFFTLSVRRFRKILT
ncbi:hypothetical protein DRQ17_05590 [bacterium]|nr:MAG: hypothetical protein DRQ17_05590 [bacterium]